MEKEKCMEILKELRYNFGIGNVKQIPVFYLTTINGDKPKCRSVQMLRFASAGTKSFCAIMIGQTALKRNLYQYRHAIWWGAHVLIYNGLSGKGDF